MIPAKAWNRKMKVICMHIQMKVKLYAHKLSSRLIIMLPWLVAEKKLNDK